MADTPATVTLEVIARLPGTEQEFDIGTLEIPIEIDRTATLQAIQQTIEENRPGGD